MRLKNPTTYFFEQANAPKAPLGDKIQKLVSQLLDLKSCKLCTEPFDLGHRLPRILIHCGHTCCSLCLESFFKRGRVRCPFCLKLIKNLDGIEVLPVNHTIFRVLAQEYNRANPDQPVVPQSELFHLFDYSQKVRAQNKNIDKETGLPYCVVHAQRVMHFFCEFHKVLACRACCQASHVSEHCKVVELYDTQDPQAYLQSQGFIDDQGYQIKADEGQGVLQRLMPSSKLQNDLIGMLPEDQPPRRSI